jgi:hypothetical protein
MNTAIDGSATKKKDKIIIYFLASPEPRDVEACKTVHKFLKQFIRNTRPAIEIYSDYSIPAGEDINKYREILYQADMVLAFGSGDFVGDDETVERVEKVILRYNKRQTVLLVILVRNFLWQEPFFRDLLILPSNKQPLLNKSFWDADDAFTVLAKELRDEITKYYSVEQVMVDIRPLDAETNNPAEI